MTGPGSARRNALARTANGPARRSPLGSLKLLQLVGVGVEDAQLPPSGRLDDIRLLKGQLGQKGIDRLLERVTLPLLPYLGEMAIS